MVMEGQFLLGHSLGHGLLVSAPISQWRCICNLIGLSFSVPFWSEEGPGDERCFSP